MSDLSLKKIHATRLFHLLWKSKKNKKALLSNTTNNIKTRKRERQHNNQKMVFTTPIFGLSETLGNRFKVFQRIKIIDHLFSSLLMTVEFLTVLSNAAAPGASIRLAWPAGECSAGKGAEYHCCETYPHSRPGCKWGGGSTWHLRELERLDTVSRGTLPTTRNFLLPSPWEI